MLHFYACFSHLARNFSKIQKGLREYLTKLAKSLITTISNQGIWAFVVLWISKSIEIASFLAKDMYGRVSVSRWSANKPTNDRKKSLLYKSDESISW